MPRGRGSMGGRKSSEERVASSKGATAAGCRSHWVLATDGGDVEFWGVNVVEMIEGRMTAGDPALWMDGEEMSYGELFGQVGRLAERLKGWRGWPGSGVPRIGLLADNGMEYVVVALAVLKAGGCFVPMPGELAGPEREELARTTALDGLLVLGRHEWPGGGELLDEGLGLRGCEIETGAPGFPVEEFEALGPAFIRFSSGTTGRSKGVVLSHRSLWERIESANRALRIGPGDRVLWTLPMAHHFAVSIVLYLRFGATTVIETARMAAEVLATAATSEATVVYGAPFHHALLAADGSGFEWPSLRLAVSTAAPLPEATARAFEKRFGRPLCQGLGVIECGLPMLNVDEAAAKPESVGRPVEGWEVSLRDEQGGKVDAGETGELWLRGPGMFDAYLEPWQLRSEATNGGWFATGDLCERDGEGALRILGRRKSVINVGGMKVFPEEVEAVLEHDPGVARSRVKAQAHPVFGSVPVAEVVAAAGAEPNVHALRKVCREALSPHKVPVAVKLVAELPLTASGKLKR
jgi:long-chain acyl-CoA synthetase